MTARRRVKITEPEIDEEFEDPEEDFEDEDSEEFETEDPEDEESEEDEPPESEPEPKRPKSGPSPRRPRRTPPTIPAVDRRGSREPEVQDISTWLGTGEAAAMVKRHPHTLKNWRTREKVRAVIGPDGCWRYNPDDLVEMMNGSEEEHAPAQMLAVGMTSIVQQSDKAGDRLLAMTEVATTGMERTIELLQDSLAKAHERIADLETRLADALDKGMANLEAAYKHERWMAAKKFAHEETMADRGESGTRLASLLQVLGPIGATIAARMGGNDEKAEKIERDVSRLDISALPFEARVTDALGRLDGEIRALDDTTYAAFRLMLPKPVQEALDAVRTPEATGDARGKALGIVVRAAVDLTKPQFEALRPVGPAGVVGVLGELRTLNEEKA